MSTNKAAAAYVLSVMEDFPGELIEVGKPDLKVQAKDLVDIARNAYEAGAQAERERIWKALNSIETDQWIVHPTRLIKGIILGGADEQATAKPTETVHGYTLTAEEAVTERALGAGSATGVNFFKRRSGR